MNDDAENQFGGLTTAEILRQRVDYIVEAGVDVLTWCTCTPDQCFYPTEVGEGLAANPELQEWTADYLGYEETTKVGPVSITELEVVVTKLQPVHANLKRRKANWNMLR